MPVYLSEMVFFSVFCIVIVIRPFLNPRLHCYCASEFLFPDPQYPLRRREPDSGGAGLVLGLVGRRLYPCRQFGTCRESQKSRQNLWDVLHSVL